jgi:HK97 gp10 family phage protein
VIKIETKFVFDFDHTLDKLSDAVGERTLRAVGFAGAEVFRNEVVHEAPKDTGFLSENVGIVRDKSQSDGNVVQTYLVKILKIKNKYANTKHNVRKNKVGKTYTTTNAFYWKFFEFGTSKMPARPFIRPSYESKKAEALQAMKNKLAEKISEALRSSQ